jgi:DUF4097 and DUF4098 domain-containing protein YvlB
MNWTLWSLAGFVLIAGAGAISLAAGQGRLLDQPRNWSQRESGDDDRGPRETETVERTATLPEKGTVRIKNFSGEVRVLPGSGRNVVVKATRRAPKETLDRVKLDVTSSGSVVTIDANRRDPGFDRRNDNVVDTQMTIEVPAAADLDIDAFSSDVTVEGMSGDQRIKTFSGTITVQGLKGEIDAETFSADIRVSLDTTTKGNVSFSSFSGRLDSDVPITTMSSGRRRSSNVEGTLQAGGGPRLRFHTFSGDVELRSR